MTHFDDIELRRWAERGAGDDRDRIVSHLAACASCAARYGEAIRRRSGPVATEANVDDFVRAGVRIARPRRLAIAIAAAAAIVLAVVLLPIVVERQSSRDELHFRGDGIRLLEPSGDVRLDQLRFAWGSGIAAAAYEVEIGKDDRVVVHAEAKRPPLVLSASQTAALARGASYWWSVAALDARGQRIAVSPRRAFTAR